MLRQTWLRRKRALFPSVLGHVRAIQTQSVASQSTKLTILSVIASIEHVLQAALSKLQLPIGNDFIPAHFGVCRSSQPNVDYQSSIALMLTNACRQYSSPRSPAQWAVALVNNFSSFASHYILQNAFVSPNGFINFILRDEYIARQARYIANEGLEPRCNSQARSILVDFAAPNYGKRLHVGHLRSSVIGDTICNLLEFQGHCVSRVSHSGDVGSAMATLLATVIESNVPCDHITSDAQLAVLYEQGKKRLGESAFRDSVDQLSLILQNPNRNSQINEETRQALSAWKQVCEISRQSYNQLFSRLNVSFQDRPESTYLSLIPRLLSDLKEREILIESRGAQCIFLENGNAKRAKPMPPLLVQKGNGGYLYATIDLACLKSRVFGDSSIDNTSYDEILYVTDQSQRLHFEQLFQAARICDWVGPKKCQAKHVPFGLVLGKDGAKLSSRNGAVESLEDLLDLASEECQRRSILTKDSKFVGETQWSTEYQTLLYRHLGDAAVRYYELSQHRERDYKFIWDHALSFKGNSGIYLLYSCARLQGILRKATTDENLSCHWEALERSKQKFLNIESFESLSRDWHTAERALTLTLCQFDDEVQLATRKLAPHILCEYLYRVASAFNVFYESCKVIGDPKMEPRTRLCAATFVILKKGLSLLGVETVKHM